MGNEDNQPLIPLIESHFWFRLLLLCKKRWKLLLPVLLTLVIVISILIGLFCVPSHSEGKSLHFLVFEYVTARLAYLQVVSCNLCVEPILRITLCAQFCTFLQRFWSKMFMTLLAHMNTIAVHLAFRDFFIT